MSTAETAFEPVGPVADPDARAPWVRALWASRDWADLDEALAAVAAACRAGDLDSDRAEELALWAAAASRNLPESTSPVAGSRIWADELLSRPGEGVRHCPSCRALLPVTGSDRPACRRCHPSPEHARECRVAA